MPTPNHPALPLCSQFAAHYDRYMFASDMGNLLIEQPQDALRSDAIRLRGMLAAYLEMDVISAEQHRGMCDELIAFAFGASA